MQYLVLTLLLGLTLYACRDVIRLRRTGNAAAAHRRYLRASWALGGTILAAMAVQELILLRAGLLTWQTGLPLHLCSLMGLTALPALLSRRPLLLHASLYAGVPGAVLALLFPAVLDTPWPRLTELAFHALHAGLVCVPLLPMATGWKPRPQGAAGAWGFLLLAAAAAGLTNLLTGGNYLFLAGPVAGTPLAPLARWGRGVYRALLALAAGIILLLEGAAVRFFRRTKGE